MRNVCSLYIICNAETTYICLLKKLHMLKKFPQEHLYADEALSLQPLCNTWVWVWLNVAMSTSAQWSREKPKIKQKKNSLPFLKRKRLGNV